MLDRVSRIGCKLFSALFALIVCVGVVSAEEPDPTFGTPELEAEFMTSGLATEIQGRLVSLGFDTKGVDGKLGPGSRQAIMDWQKAQELYQTGFLTLYQVELLQFVSHKSFKHLLAQNSDLAEKMPRMTFFNLDVEPDPPMTPKERAAFRAND